MWFPFQQERYSPLHNISLTPSWCNADGVTHSPVDLIRFLFREWTFSKHYTPVCSNSPELTSYSLQLSVYLCVFWLTKTVKDSYALPQPQALSCSVCNSLQSHPSEQNPLYICKINITKFQDTVICVREMNISILLIFICTLTSHESCVDYASPGKGWSPYRNECGCYILMMNPPGKMIGRYV